MNLPFLLEIGTEEIPDWMIVPAVNHLQNAFQVLLDQQSLTGKVTRVEATPRRLVLRAEGLLDRQPDTEEVVLGPPTSAGPGAAAGFAKKMGTTPDQLGSQTTAKGEYLSFSKRTQGQAAAAILTRDLPALILGIPWRKSMYWNGKGSERFIRPIRWMVALLGGSIVPFEIGGVRSGNTTAGHRLLGKPSIPVTVDNFEDQLKANGVILSADERRSKIEAGIAAALDGKGLRVKPDPDLLHTLVYITESPTPILGSFDRQYLELPQEVLVTVMKHHQKYFSLEDAEGELAPHFIAVMNTNADPQGLVRQGNERVLRARFNDARFFWQVDMKRTLEDRLPDLKNVTFQAKVGSYFQKTERVVALVKELGGDQNAQRAALLCKCDLTTDMVKEFTDLQGIMGGLYAEAQGELEEVCGAIYEHYRPLSMEDWLPRSRTRQLVALADKVDTLRECFRVGLTPTGSKDPFALRRAAQGIIRILVEAKLDFRLSQLSGPDQQLREFLLDRIRYYFREVRGFRYDEVNAALGGSFDSIIDLEPILEALRELHATPALEPIADSFKRIRNILRQAEFIGNGQVLTELLEPGPERDLYDSIAETIEHVSVCREERAYLAALEHIAINLRPKVDLFFDKVLVNAPDEAVRRNRLTLLHNLLTEFSTIADFSEIVTEKTP